MFKETNTGGLERTRILFIGCGRLDDRFLAAFLGTDLAVDFELRIATHLTEALDVLESEHVDVAVIDISLPESMALDTLAKVFDAAPNAAVIALTDFTNTDVEFGALKQCGQKYLVKGTFDGPALKVHIHDALECRDWNRDLILPDAGNLADEIANNTAAAILCWDEYFGKLNDSFQSPS